MTSSVDIFALVCALTVLILPGAALVLALGQRGGRLIVFAVPATTLLVALSTTLAHLLRSSWDVVTASSLMTGLIALTFGVRWLLLRGHRGLSSLLRQGEQERQLHPISAVVPVVTLGLSALLVVPPTLRGMGGLATLNGSYDSFFHLSALRFVRDSGDAFMFTALAPMYGGQNALYPTTWHALAALLPGDVVVASNALLLALLVMIPVSALSLVLRVLSPYGVWGGVCASAIALTASVFASPSVMGLVMGLWPYLLGTVAMVSASGALIHRTSFVLRVVLIAGVMAAHPSALFSLAVVAAGALTVCALSFRRGTSAQTPIALLAGLGAAGIAAAMLVVVPIRFSDMSLTKPVPTSLVSTALTLLADRPRIRAIPFDPWPLAPILVLAVFGLLLTVRRRDSRGAIFTLIGVSGAVLIFSTQSDHPWFHGLSSVWYGARERIHPLVIVGILGLAGVGCRGLLDLSVQGGQKTTRPLPPRRGAESSRSNSLQVTSDADHGDFLKKAVSVVIAMALLLPAMSNAVASHRQPLTASLAYSAYGLQLLPYAAPKEVRFIERTSAELRDGAVVLGSPLDGASLYHALGGIDVVYPSLADPQSLDQRRIGRYAGQLSATDPVCESMKNEQITHVYVDRSAYRTRYIGGDRIATFGGIAEIPRTYMTLVSADGPFELYSVDLPCS